ncbi:MAG: citrate synthase family protein [Desulfobulbaceae bacterium]|jgi:citrate synthase
MKIIMSSASKAKLDKRSPWDAQRGVIHTDKGGMVIGEAIYCHGFSLLDDLVGKASFFQVLVLNSTGIFPEKRLADWLETAFLCASYPDARIWCNQIGSLAGTLRCTPVAAVSAGIFASDSKMYGPGTQKAGVCFIREALQKKINGKSVTSIIHEHPHRTADGRPAIPGYIRPLIQGDERIGALERVTAELGFTPGAHLQLGYELSEELLATHMEGMNAMGYVAAFLCDQGFFEEDQYRLMSTLVHSGVIACYAEAADRTPETFFPLHCDDIRYCGPPPRIVPEKNQGHKLEHLL